MFMIRSRATKFFITTLFVILVVCKTNLQGKPIHSKKPTNHRKTMYRKFNSAAFFAGLANSCANVGAAITAQTEQEKKQAACNVLASVFQTAAALSEKTQKKRSLAQDDNSTTIKSVITLLDTIPQQEREQLLTPNCTYLHAIAGLQTKEIQAQFIDKIFENKEESKAFLKEVFSLFKVLTADQLPTVFDELQTEVIKNLVH